MQDERRHDEDQDVGRSGRRSPHADSAPTAGRAHRGCRGRAGTRISHPHAWTTAQPGEVCAWVPYALARGCVQSFLAFFVMHGKPSRPAEP